MVIAKISLKITNSGSAINYSMSDLSENLRADRPWLDKQFNLVRIALNALVSEF